MGYAGDASRRGGNGEQQIEIARRGTDTSQEARAYSASYPSAHFASASIIGTLAPLRDRARVRLACTNAIQGAVEVADFAYKGAGVDAIFPGSPFERRFRDMHTLTQQIQARGAHFESVGQILLGVPPEEFL
jgi:hypothetical protein